MKSLVSFLILAGTAVAAPGMHHARIVDRAEVLAEEYDFVVIGAGTAGLTLADRLTEDGKNSVLVIEYGYVISDEVTARGGGRSFSDPGLRYNITSTPQPGMNNRTQDVVVGCCVGGSSAINGMVMMRGTSDEYDAWRELAGPEASKNSTWDWKGVLPYFKKAIHYTPAVKEVRDNFNVTYDPEVWGESSAIYASYPDYVEPAVATMYDAMASVHGVDIPLDGAAGTNGLFWFPTSMFPPGHEKQFQRSYARTGHYDTIVSRENLEVLQGHKVTRILLEKEDGKEDVKAVGVEFRRRGKGYSGDKNGGVEGGFGGTDKAEQKKRQEKAESVEVLTVKARKEVILSAGAVHSPQILQLSGIGPKALLESANIDVVVELPGVGQNFQDHAWIGNMAYTLSTPLKGPEMNLTGDSRFAGMNLGAWLGMPVVSPDRYSAIADRYMAQEPAAFLPPGTHPDVIEGYRHFQAAHSKLLRTKNSNWLWVPITSAPGGRGVMLMHVVSHGTININPANPHGEPVVDYRSLSNPIDLELLVEHVKFMRRFVLESGQFDEYKPVETSPGPDVKTDEDLKEFIRQSVTPTNYHPVATTSKMPREWGGVVDEELRVWGVKSLRVVDAGIMPSLPGAQTQQSSYMIGEKGADFVKGAWK